MSFRSAFAIFIASTVWGEAVWAQPAEQGMGLPELIERALETSPDLAEIRAEIDKEHAHITQARGGRLPRAQYDQVFGLVNQARGNAVFSPDIDTDLLNGLGPFTRIDFYVVQPIYTFGAITSGIEAAESGLVSRLATERGGRAEVVESVAELYYNLLLNRELKGSFKDLVSGLKEALEKAEERLSEGEAGVTQEDVLKLRFALAGLEEKAAEVDMGWALARSALRRAVGIPPDGTLHVAETDLRPLEVELEPLEHYVGVAFHHRPEVESLQAAVKAREADAARLRAELYPSLFATVVMRYAVAPNRTDQKNAFVRDDFNYLYAGLVLGLSWRFDFGKLGDIDEVEADERKLRAQYAQLTSGLRLEVEQALRQVENARRRVELSRGRRKTSRSLLVVATANYELGIGTAQLILESLGMHAEGVGKYYEAVRDFNLGLARLYRTTGLLQTEEYQKVLRGGEEAAP